MLKLTLKRADRERNADMDEVQLKRVRSFVGKGLDSLLSEDMDDARGNLMWAKQAQRDWEEIQKSLSPEEIRVFQENLQELEAAPKMAANAGDSLLDLEGVRCIDFARILVFYRYNANYQLVFLIRLALDEPEWKELVRDGKPVK